MEETQYFPYFISLYWTFSLVNIITPMFAWLLVGAIRIEFWFTLTERSQQPGREKHPWIADVKEVGPFGPFFSVFDSKPEYEIQKFPCKTDWNIQK